MFQEVPSNSSNHILKFRLPYFQINYEFDDYSSYTHGGFSLFYKDFGGRKKYPNEGGLVLLGLSTALTEDDLVVVMPKAMGQHYINHNSKSIIDRWCKTALEAFNSLKERLQLSEGKHIVLFEAKK